MLFRKEKKLKFKIAYIISRLSEPFVLLAIFGLLIMGSDFFIGYNKWIWGLGLVFILGVLPLITLLIGVRRFKNIDIDFTKRENRTPFILMIIFYWLIGLSLAWGLSAPRLVIDLLVVGLISILTVLLINFYWKISNHSLVISAVVLFVNELFGFNYWWLFLFIPFVFWSRLIQKKHTLGQLFGGAGLAVVAWIILRNLM